MPKITFVCNNLKDTILLLKIEEYEFYFDSQNTQNQVIIPSGTYDILFIHSKNKDFQKYSSLGHKINFKFLLPYKDKNYFNHLFGWENRVKQCITSLKVKIKNDTHINITFEENFTFNFFESKDYFNKIKMAQNNKFKILGNPKNYIFYNKTQKNKYYFTQLFLVFLYYFIGIFLASVTLYESLVHTETYHREATIATMIFLITLFLIRFSIYLFRIIKRFYLNEAILKI